MGPAGQGRRVGRLQAITFVSVSPSLETPHLTNLLGLRRVEEGMHYNQHDLFVKRCGRPHGPMLFQCLSRVSKKRYECVVAIGYMIHYHYSRDVVEGLL